MNTTQQPDPAYDIVILGASGFTGKYVVREALKFLQTPSSPLKTLALAGRNPTRLTQSLQWAARPNPPPSSVAILTADTSDPDSLRRLCTQTKLILNCVGPFRIHGDPVVAACADSGCDYLDISGEPEFMERMEAKYHERAEETGSLIVSACGFDSIPAELGLLFNSKQWEPPSVPNQIEAYLSLESDKKIAGNFGTYESAVLGVANAEKLKELRRLRPTRPRPSIHGPPAKGPTLENQKKIGLWALKLPSADAVVVRRTLTTLTEKPHGLPGLNETPDQIQKREAFWSTIKPAHFGVKITSKSLFGIFRYVTLGVSLGLLAKFSFGRWLLLKFPSVFSLGWFQKKGPSEEEVESATFKMWFIGRGYSEESLIAEGKTKPDMEIITRISGPEIGYITTPIALVQCGLIVLGQRESLVKGGVYTPGIVFGSTDIQQRLEENGISFEVISKNKIQD
uniref:Putative mitochondrial saccharopine dehydrogenase-like oxidoreductase n=1 Tax=Noccaea caerulescens TaxID=107243 RepID=A0A1J3EWV1_NOCCA